VSSLTVIETHGSTEPVAREWDELADRTKAAPFLRPGWVAAWWSAFGAGALEIVAARRGGRLVGLIPLTYRRGSLESATNWHTPEFGIVAEDGAAALELATALFARSPRRVSLSFLNSANTDLDMCRTAAGAQSYLVLERTLERPPFVTIEGDWAAYEGQLAANVRRDLRRRRRLLEQEGKVSFTVDDGMEQLEERLQEGFRVEGSGWKGESGTAIVSRPETRQFYSDVARWAAERGWLRLAFLRLDGRPLAFQYGLEDDGVYYFLKGGYDPAYARLSPGRLLVRAMLERSFSDGLTRFDFGGTGELFKLEWANGARELVRFQGFARSPVGLLDWAASPVFTYGPPVVRRVLALGKR
jgi:CelD/BcsL family acetyltransferase involved in cellulose biosynthesis